jgi:hypothetical protein
MRWALVVGEEESGRRAEREGVEDGDKEREEGGGESRRVGP